MFAPHLHHSLLLKHTAKRPVQFLLFSLSFNSLTALIAFIHYEVLPLFSEHRAASFFHTRSASIEKRISWPTTTSRPNSARLIITIEGVQELQDEVQCCDGKHLRCRIQRKLERGGYHFSAIGADFQRSLGKDHSSNAISTFRSCVN